MPLKLGAYTACPHDRPLGIAATPDVNGRAMADRVLSELAGQRGRLIVVTGDRHEPTSHELTPPDPLARLLTNLPGDVHAMLATVAISRCACISCAWPAS